MKGSKFRDAVTSTTKLFGRKNVEVVFAGSQAHTNGNRVTLPAIPDAANVPHESAMVLRGYRDHEALHLRMSDMGQMLQAVGAAATTDPILENCLQNIEDGRIETAGVNLSIGVRQSITAVNNRITTMTIENLAEQNIDVARVPVKTQVFIAYAETIRQLGDFGGEHAKPLLSGMRDDCRALGEKYAKLCRNLPNGYDAPSNNIDDDAARRAFPDVLALSQAMAEEIKELTVEDEPKAQKPPPPREPPCEDGEPEDGDRPVQTQSAPEEEVETPEEKGEAPGEDGESQPTDDDTESGDDGQPGGDGDADGDEDDADDGDGGDGSSEGDADEGDAADDDDSSAKGGNFGAAGNADADDDDDAEQEFTLPSASDVVSETVEHIKDAKQSPHLAGKPYLLSDDGVVVLRPAKRRTKQDKIDLHGMIGTAAREKVKGHVAMVRRRVEQALQAQFDRVWTNNHKRGRLNSMRLVNAVQGERNVYRQRTEGRDLDTYVHIAIDKSASMAYLGLLENAGYLAIALGTAIEKIGCDLTIDDWSDAGDAASLRLQLDLSAMYYQRARQGDPDFTSGLMIDDCFAVIHRIKEQRERMSSPGVTQGIGRFMEAEGGGTPLAPVLNHLVTEVASKPHARRILIVLTDGDPNTNDERGYEYLDSVNARAAQEGVKLLGIGVGHDASRCFSRHVQVSGSGMYAAAMDAIAKLLTE